MKILYLLLGIVTALGSALFATASGAWIYVVLIFPYNHGDDIAPLSIFIYGTIALILGSLSCLCFSIWRQRHVDGDLPRSRTFTS